MDVQKKNITQSVGSGTIFVFAVIFIFSLTTCSTRNLLNAEKVGSIFVNSTPVGGNIILDHRLLAGMVTPATILGVAVGKHVISVTKEGYLASPDSMEIAVEENEVDTAEFVLLSTSSGSLKVSSNVDGATICIDHKPTVGVTPYVFYNNVPVGARMISVFKEGYSNQEPAKEVVNIVTQDTVEVDFVLNPAVVGKAAGNITPDFELEDDYGFWHRFYAYRGLVTMVFFWAESCDPCKLEMPYLQQIYLDYLADSLIIFGINYEDDFPKIQERREKNQLTFLLLKDEGSQVKKNYEVNGTPVTIILDRGGKIYFYMEGFAPGRELKLIQKLNQLFGR